jgi:FAD/FMN-containing dehydrogenase
MMDKIYQALLEIVGEDYVSVHKEDLFTYSKDLGTSEPQWPDFVVAPKNTEEVSRIVKMANREKVAIVPLGGGMSLAGLALPLKGGICIDLKRLDQIIEVNEASRYIVVEGGVSEGKITSHLRKHYPTLMHSEPGAPPAATVGGNMSIHGQGDLAHPYGFNSDMINGMEVVLPTGEVCELGSCAVGSEWFTLHPLPDLSMFLGWNGSTGIITKLSMRLFPCKLIRESDIFVVENEELVPEILYEMTHIGQSEDLVAFSSAIPPFADRLHHINANITGDSEEEMAFKRHLLFDGKLSKYIQEGVGGLVGTGLDIQKPAISKSADWKKGGGFEYVGAIVPVSFYPECYRRGAEISIRHDIPYTVLGRVIGCSHGMMFSWSFAFNRADEDSVRHAREALHETDELVMELKGTIWKPAVFGQSLMMDRMNPNTLQMMKKVKQMLDPQGIMNPGNWEVR